MKYCCEKYFSGEKKFYDYLIRNHEKVGDCDYCGAKNVKLIDVSKMREPFFEIINKEYFTVDKGDTVCMGEDYYSYGDYEVVSIERVFDCLEDELLADEDWQLNDRLFYDACNDDDFEVFYLGKSSLPDAIKKQFEKS